MRVRRKKAGYIVVEKGQARGAELLRVRRQVHSAAAYSRLELDGPVAAISEAGENGMKVRKEEDVRCRVAGKILFQAEMMRFLPEISPFQTLQCAGHGVIDVCSRIETFDRVDDNVEIVERRKICRNNLGRSVEYRLQLIERDRLSLEFPAGTAPQNHPFNRVRGL